MPLYLAYQFEPKQLTKDKLALILDDYFDFELKEIRKCPKNSTEWFDSVESELKRFRSLSSDEGEHLFKEIGSTWLQKASYFAYWYNVKNHPLLNIYFRFKEKEFYYCPQEFTGLNIWAEHSGSEGIVDLLEIKPEMDAYLRFIGIDYEDKSKITLE